MYIKNAYSFTWKKKIENRLNLLLDEEFKYRINGDKECAELSIELINELKTILKNLEGGFDVATISRLFDEFKNAVSLYQFKIKKIMDERELKRKRKDAQRKLIYKYQPMKFKGGVK